MRSVNATSTGTARAPCAHADLLAFDAEHVLSADEFDAVAQQVASFVDMRSAYRWAIRLGLLRWQRRRLVRGLSNRQVAECLFLAPKTVGHHIERIYEKTGVSTRVGATLFAIEHGLVPPLAGQIRRRKWGDRPVCPAARNQPNESEPEDLSTGPNSMCRLSVTMPDR